MVGRLRVLSLSDVHLHHKRTPTQFIVDNLNAIISYRKDLIDIDIIFIPGDLTDQLVYLSDSDTAIIQEWMVGLLRLCVENDIVLRVMEGTPSHDRGQSEQFTILNRLARIECDVRYINTVYIEYIDRFDINILYVPDEIASTHERIQTLVADTLDGNGLTKVDIILMHGIFEHQIPVNVPCPTHNRDYYMGIVKYFIFIGHVHKSSQYKCILSQGSTDRIAHGEEEPKGYWDVTMGDETKVVFVENKNAMIYRTLDITGKSIDETAVILKKIHDIPSGHHIRVKYHRNADNVPTLMASRQFHNDLQWTLTPVAVERSKDDDAFTPSLYVATVINRNTIQELLSARLTAAGESEENIQTAMRLLEDQL